jgi:serine/threonine-protein kinase
VYGAAVQPGDIVNEKYRLESVLGRGGMGSVWRARHLELDAPIALKLMNADVAESSTGLQRFIREAKAAANLRSPHVVQVLDHGVDASTSTPFIVLELLEGESLADRLTARGRLPAAEVGRIVTHIARALSRAHELGVVHRDLKPANVFLVRNDDEEIAKVLDFGIAKWSEEAALQASPTGTGNVLGTPRYMSPEQLTCAKTVDHRTDLWSLALIAAECLTGRPSFDAQSLPSLILKVTAGKYEVPSQQGPVPAGFDEWFEHAVRLEREDRFSSATEMAAALRNICGTSVPWPSASSPAAAPRPGTSPAAVSQTALSPTVHFGGIVPVSCHPEPSAKRRPSARQVLVAAAALVATVGAGLAWLSLARAPAQVQVLQSRAAVQPAAAAQGSNESAASLAPAGGAPAVAAPLPSAPESRREPQHTRQRLRRTKPRSVERAAPAPQQPAPSTSAVIDAFDLH